MNRSSFLNHYPFLVSEKVRDKIMIVNLIHIPMSDTEIQTRGWQAVA